MSLPIFPPFILVSLVVFACCLISAGISILLTNAKFKKRKFLKTRIIIALSVVGIITLYFLFYTVSSLIGRNSVKAMWDKVKAAGISIKTEKIIPKSPENPPDNAVFLYKAASALIRNSNVPTERFNLCRKADKARKKNGHKYVPPQYNTSMYDISNWKNEDKAEAIKSSKNKDVQQAIGFFSRAVHKPYANNLQRLTMQRANYPEFELQTLMPQLNNYRELFRMISFVSSCYAAEGKVNKSYDLIIDGFKFIHQFRNEPLMISHLVYIACDWINLRALNSLIPRYGISSEKAQKIIDVLNKLDFNRSMKKGFSGELVFFTKPIFEELITGDTHRALSFHDSKDKAFADCIYLSPFIYQQYAGFINSFLKNYELYDKPYWQIKSQLEKLQKEKVNFLFMKDAHSIMRPLRIKVARMNSTSAATKIILALHIYKNQHGQFPDKLDVLIPGILKGIKVDAASGKPLSYKKEGKYFKLSGFYSGGK